MSTLYRAIWSDSSGEDRRSVVDLARRCVSAWALSCDDSEDLPDGDTKVGIRTITMRTLDQGGQYGFDFLAVDSPGPYDSGQDTWKTQVRVVSTDDEVHTWVENGMETNNPTIPVAVGRPRLVDDLLRLPGKHRLGASGVFPGVQPIRAEEVEVLEELLRNPARQLPVIVVSERVYTDGREKVLAERIAKRAGGVATVITLDGAAVTKFRERLGDLAVWGGGVRTYVRAPLESRQDGWRHRYVPGTQLREVEGRMVDRIVYGVTQLSTRRRIPEVFRIFERPDATVAASELARIEEEWAEKLELEYAERNEVERELARALGHLDRLKSRLTEQGNAELIWAASYHSAESDDPPEQVDCTSDAVAAAQLYLDECLEIPESAPRDLADIDAAPNAYAWGNTTWRGLRALSAYATARRDGFEGNFWIWCERGEPLAWPATSKKLSMRESESVENRERFRKLREFEVSTDVDPSGSIAMWAHLKISEGGGDLAPRVYFHDDTGGKTRKVHIGLVGPHYLIPNTKT